MIIERSVRIGTFCFVFFGFFTGLILMGCAGMEPKGSLPIPETEEAGPDAAPNFNRRDYNFPGELRFVPAPFSIPEVPSGVGLLTGEPGDRSASLQDAEKEFLERAFRSAYIEGLFREIPLTGVLGGDLVHGWPAAAPLGWVQNWRSGIDYPNSWGLPPLILAVMGIDRDRVFMVHGPILDAYGKSAGLNGANGILGYGYPRGDEFFYNRGMAQRFSLGIITVDGEGAVSFIPGRDLPAKADSSVEAGSSIEADSSAEADLFTGTDSSGEADSSIETDLFAGTDSSAEADSLAETNLFAGTDFSLEAVPPDQVGVFPGGSQAMREDFRTAWGIWVD
jgi:hypothetical protein